MAKAPNVKCPVCESKMSKVDLPKQNIYVCKTCEELVQVLSDGTLLTITNLLERAALGDDRVRAAISRPTVTTAKNFMDEFDASVRAQHRDMGALSVELRSILAKVENRLDFAMEALSGLDLALPEIGGALSAIREARETVSTLPAANRGLAKENDDDLSSFTIQTAGTGD